MSLASVANRLIVTSFCCAIPSNRFGGDAAIHIDENYSASSYSHIREVCT